MDENKSYTMTSNKFVEFNTFVYETTGSYLKFADSFQNLYIYVPNDKKIPIIKKNSSSSRTVSVQNYFANRSKDFCQLVYNDDWNLLEGHLGPDLLRFCFCQCIFARRTKAGGFMVSSLSNLRNKITPEIPQKLNQIFYHTAKCCTENSSEPTNNSDAFGDKKSLQKWKEYEKNLNHLFCHTDLEISIDDLLFKISKDRKFPDSHILVKTNARTTMSARVMNTRVGSFPIAEYQEWVEPLELILQKLKKLHNKYNYERSLRQLIASSVWKNTNEKTENGVYGSDPLPIRILKIYFTNICSSVIPKELFGSHKNRNTLVKVICDLLETPKQQSLSLKPYILKMRISDMRWLDEVKNTDAQWTVLAKLLKWILNKYISDIFRSQLYIIVTNSSEKIYFTQKDWQELTNKFLQRMCKEKIIASINGFETKAVCDGRWLLFPKKNGVRPIMSQIRGTKRNNVTRSVLCYLQQLYVTKYDESGEQTFLKQWRSLVSNLRNNDNKTIYLISCDIEYAFGSINQRKLVQIVESLADLTGPEINLKNYMIARNLKAVKSESLKSKLCVTYPELELPVAPGAIMASRGDTVVKVSKETLLREIKESILNQNILVSNQRYLLEKGIPQGATLSSILCDIYYAHMEDTCLSEFKQAGFLHRYVDDILFATKDRALAERFLLHVKNGFPNYNCSFNAAKTWTNLPGYDLNSKPITYLGFNIDPITLEVHPDYSKSARYTTTLSKPRYKILETFRKRLSNLASLKLDGVILDLVINSEDTVVCNIKSVFRRQAERCTWLLKALFDDISLQLTQIFRIIKLTNLKIIRRIQRYFLTNGYDFEKLVPRLVVIPWKCYREVLGKAPKVHSHFRYLFLKSLKMNELAAAAILENARNRTTA